MLSQTPDRPNLYDKDSLRTGEWVLYYDSLDNKVSKDSTYVYCLLSFDKGKPSTNMECFFMTGIKQWDGKMSSIDPDIKHGKATFYYPLGNIQQKANYINNVVSGELEGYYDNGQVQYIGLMKEDKNTGYWEYFYENGQMMSKGNFIEGAQDGYWEFYLDNGQQQTKGNIKNAMYNGKWIVYHRNGNLQNIASYVDNKKEGIFKGYHENGKLSQTGFYTNDLQNGYFKYYHDNGTIESEGKFLKGMFQGPWKFYFNNGNLASSRSYIDDKENGYFKYYYEEGSLKSEGNVTNENWDGDITFYYQNGKINSHGEIVNGIYQGPWKSYFDNGNLNVIKTYVNDTLYGYWEKHYENGLLQEKGDMISGLKEGDWEIYYSNGQLSYRGSYKNNFKTGFFDYYYENGNRKNNGTYSESIQNGQWKYYHDNGVISSQGIYENGKSEGNWKYYYDNKVLKKEGNEHLDKHNGYWKYYFESSILKSEGEELMGNRNGIWKYYHPNGNLKTSGNTSDGGAIGIWHFYDSLGRKTSQGKWQDNLKDSIWVYYDTLGRSREIGNFVNNKADGKWWIYKDGKKDHKEYWDRGTELNFWNLRDSSERVAKRHDNDLAFKIAKAAKKEWGKTYNKNEVGYHFYWSMMGYVNSNLGRYHKSEEYYERSLKEVARIESDTSWNYAIVIGKMANNYYSMGLYQKSVDNYEKELNILAAGSEGKSDLSYFNIINQLSRAYLYNGQAGKGIQLLKEDIRFRLEIEPDQTDKIAEDYGRLGELYYRDYTFDSAIYVYDKFFTYLKDKKIKNHFMESESYRQMAYVYGALNQYDSVSSYFNKAIQILKHQNKTSSISFVLNYNGLANNYYSLNRYKEMDQYADSTLFLIEQNNLKNFDIYHESLITKARASVQLYRYQEAKEAYELALESVLSKTVVDKQLLSNCYQGLGICYESNNNTELAIEYYQKSVDVYPNPANYNAYYTNAHLLFSSLYTGQKNYVQSRFHLTILKNYLEKLNHPDSYKEGRVYEEFGLLAYKQYDYDSAKIHFRKALTFYGDEEKYDVFKYAELLDNLADIEEALNHQDEAQKLILESLSLLEEKLGKKHESYISQLYSLAIHHQQKGNYQNAIVLLTQVLESREELYGQASSGYVNVENSLANTYLFDGQYSKAIAVAEGMKEHILDYSDKGDEDYLSYFKVLADVNKKQDKFEESKYYYGAWLNAAEKLYGTNHEDYAYYLRQTGRMYKHFGKNETALPYLQSAVNILAITQGTQNQKYAWSLETLGEIQYSLENYKEALSAKEQIISIYKNVYGDESNYHIEAKSSLANLYYKLGRYADSEELYHETLSLCERAKGTYSMKYADLLEDLGSMYRWWEKPDKAIKQAELAIEILDSLEDIEGSKYFGLYNVMGLALQDLGRLNESEHYYLKARDGAMKTWGKTGAYYTYINNLSFVYFEREEYAKAEKMMLEAGDRFKSREVVYDLDLVNYEDNLAALYLAWGKMDLAEKYWNNVTSTLLTRINSNFSYMSESEKANFWDAYKRDFEYFNSYAIKASKNNPQAIGQMYDNQLQTKSILLSSSTKERTKIMNSGDSTLVNKYFNYIDLKEKLSKYYSYTNEQLVNENIKIDSLEDLANDYEKTLSLNTNDLVDEENAKKVRWKDIQRKLKDNEAAVEIIRFRHFEKHVTDSVIYAALILTSETRNNPDLVVLPNGTALETKFMKNYLTSVKFKVEDKYSFTQYWEKIDEKLKDKSVVYFSPDGVFNQINVNTFSRSDGTYIIDDYNIHILTSTKDILLLDKRVKKSLDNQVATLFGFPKYDLKHSSIENIVIERSLERSRNLERDIDLTRFGFSELPGTKTETESIADILSSNQWQTNLYLADEALEEILKCVNSPNVLHIATHGFFLDDVEGDKMQLGVSAERSRKNPLLRSGLLLAGAAQTVQGDYENKTENGIFTAYEAMNLDLSNTELVVLSACETGKGEVKSGEGVYGLQRAFQIAGAESLIMSLWKVNDDATQLLMTSFYKNWIAGLSKNEAFKKAQIAVRTHFPDPYYWGAFVMVGE